MVPAALITAQILAAQPEWTLAAGGDLMLNGITPGPGVFREVASAFSSADAAYANLEIPLTNSRTPTSRKTAAELRARTQFVLKASPGHADSLSEAGFDLLSLANNHAMDYGWQGLSEMISLLNERKLAWSGAGQNRAEAHRPAVFRVKGGCRVGMISALAFVTSSALGKCGPAGADSPGIAVFDLGGAINLRTRAILRERIAQAKRSCDFLIVAPHWGTEKQTRPRAWQIQLGRALIEEGADAVIGAHPHVLQGKEVYKGKPILYSTGNLVSPLPASTAIYRLRFRGTQLQEITFRPAQIRGGRVRWLAPQEEAAATRRIEALDRLIG